MKVIKQLFNLVRSIYMMLLCIIFFLFTIIIQIVLSVSTFKYHPLLHPKIKKVLKEIYHDISKEIN